MCVEMEPGDWLFVPAGLVHDEDSPDDVHGEFLYARDGGGGTTTFLDDYVPRGLRLGTVTLSMTPSTSLSAAA